MLTHLLKVKLQTVKGSLLSSKEGRHRGPLFLLLSVLFAVMLFRGTLWLVRESLAIQPVGELILQKLLSIAFIVFLGLLLFSNVVSVFSTFYLAEDLDLLFAQPIGSDALYTSRYLEALTQSSWVIILFGLPAFVALGYGLNADWSYYAMLLAVLLPFVAIPTGIATLVALAVTNMLVASRMRDAALFLGLAAFVALFTLIRWMQPELLLNPESFDSLGEMIKMLSTPKRSFLPSDWAVNVLSSSLFGQREADLWAMALLYSTPLALYFIAAWCHRRGYALGYSRVQEGRHGEGLMTSARDYLLKRSTRRGGGALARLERQAQGDETSHYAPLAQLMRKDRRVFVRDASQWSNLLVIVALMVIYLVNYKYFEIANETRFFGDIGLYYFNLAVCAFVVVALSGRFLFPGISLEGKSFWLLMQAPISVERVLIGKWWGAMAPVLIVGQFMIWASSLLVRPDAYYAVTGSLMILFLTVCIAGIAVGLGAIYPQFYNPNASAIAASFGALIFMISSIFMVLLSIASSYWFLRALHGVIVEGAALHTISMRACTGLALSVLFPALLTYAAVRLGAYSLRRRV